MCSVLNKSLEESNEKSTTMRGGCAIFHGQILNALIIQSKKVLGCVGGHTSESCAQWAVASLVQCIADDMVEGTEAGVRSCSTSTPPIDDMLCG
jgi:hypothetical protein